MPFKSSTQPLCRCCGKKIAKWTTSAYLWNAGGSNKMADERLSRNVYIDDPAAWPKTKADCQKISNQTVISIQRHGDGRVWVFAEWDGESYKDGTFCTNNCAIDFAYGMAKNFPTYGGEGWRKATADQEG